MVNTFIEYYAERFNETPPLNLLRKIALRVSWNIWQMDGLKDTVPFGIPEDEFIQESLFEDEQSKAKFCCIRNWRAKAKDEKVIEYKSLKEKRKK